MDFLVAFLMGAFTGATCGMLFMLILEVREDDERKRRVYMPWKGDQ
jgi:hypothetical protein